MSEIKAVTYTTEEAAKRHPGIEGRHFARLCIRGKGLLKKYGDLENVPPEEMVRVLFGKKVGKYWVIPAEELDRFFMPTASESLKKSKRKSRLSNKKEGNCG